ncbi:allophanate hydrolase [Bordetella genomosp. 4]|uniref:Allophanate hydrolase n=1 Tax=Bordetella genomosp. 4 TaxID=463044 RepID=A0A261V2R4_9BORD|nr:allophanate hydrolase [Bordetella genomosp. 4]OZI67820.1 allophanate hydrolase [Bordetella genomosp. 4]
MDRNAVIDQPKGWTLAEWQAAYRIHGAQPAELLGKLIADLDPTDPAWICCADSVRLNSQLDALAQRLAAVDGELTRLPLYGVPFAIKDNIDAAGWPTTAACPAYAYTASEDAEIVRRLRAAGAILIGKTNLDQFATGLVGTRSPHGAVPNTFNPAYVSGGSSSGSASIVARGLAAFSLGTDTAGSGRVPAGFNNIVGLKPTKGWFSTRGVVPACRTLDCVSIFALTVADADSIATIAGGYDAQDPYSRPAPAMPAHLAREPRLAIPAQLEFYGDAHAQAAYEEALQALQDMGATLEPIDYSAFRELAELLYQGPWVAERYAAVRELYERAPDEIDPVVRSIIEQAARYSAVDTFEAEYRRAALTRTIQQALSGFDALVVPTAPSIYTIAQLREDPIALNTRLGTYTNFTNLADLSALAVPAGLRADGLPSGITLIGLAWQDRILAELGRRWEDRQSGTLGATGRFKSNAAPAAAATPAGAPQTVTVAVVGAHLRGMPLNHQLTSRHARFVEATHSAPTYRLYALANSTPAKPGMARVSDGAAIALELWELSHTAFGEFVAEIPPPLGIGTLELADGRLVKGFICEPCGIAGARDITEFGGWRAYLDHLKNTATQ